MNEITDDIASRGLHGGHDPPRADPRRLSDRPGRPLRDEGNFRGLLAAACDRGWLLISPMEEKGSSIILHYLR